MTGCSDHGNGGQCLKKCATMLGVALYIYSGTGTGSSGVAETPHTKAKTQDGVYCGAGAYQLPSGGGSGTSSQEKGNGHWLQNLTIKIPG
jgi:hypothetical protein